MMIIDRFEGNYAICEDNGQIITISKDNLPQNCHEGSVIQFIDNRYELMDDTLRREQMREKMNALFK